MFRLVGFNTENLDIKHKEVVVYMSGIASEMLIEKIEYLYNDEEDFDERYAIYFESDDFFKGFGQYLNMEDNEAGRYMIKLKVDHMLDRLKDKDDYYTFDLLEEFILYTVYLSFDFYIEEKVLKLKDIYSRDKKKEVEDALVEKYEFSRRKASKIAKQLLLITEIFQEEDENLFYWDKDFEYIFGRGFVEGIKMIESYAGLNMGYGYDYACKMFSNVGIKPPVFLLGTKEAYEISYQESEKEIYKGFNKLFNE